MSIHGIGNDCIEIDRIAASLARHGDRFVERILGPQELRLFAQLHAASPARGVLFLASRFAAKEAIAKALRLGMVPPMHWRAVQILPDERGGPVVHCDAPLTRHLQQHQLRLHVSISDLEHLATAFAIAEQVGAADGGLR